MIIISKKYIIFYHYFGDYLYNCWYKLLIVCDLHYNDSLMVNVLKRVSYAYVVLCDFCENTVEKIVHNGDSYGEIVLLLSLLIYSLSFCFTQNNYLRFSNSSFNNSLTVGVSANI